MYFWVLKKTALMKDIRGLPVIMCSMSRWDGNLSSAAFSLAKELAKTNQVFYFDYPYTLKDYWQGRKTPSIRKRRKAILGGEEIYTQVADAGPGFRAVTPRVMLPFYFLPEGRLYDFVVGINNRRFFKTVRQVLKENQIDRFVFFNSFNPFYGFELPDSLKSRVIYIYQTRDNLRELPGLREHGPGFEQKAARNADLVIATSSRLREILMTETEKEVFLLPNAAETSLFKTVLTSKFTRPADFPDTGRKVVAFIGNIGPRMDLELMDQVLKYHADKDFVMIGPDNLDEFNGPDIREHPNVYILGAKRLEELPAYLKYIEVTIIPFLKNELTRSIYPLKLHEQLAAGKPIVTTDFSEDVKAFADVTYLATSTEEFVKAIDVAFKEDNQARKTLRCKKSEGNSWTDRVEQFWQLLENV